MSQQLRMTEQEYAARMAKVGAPSVTAPAEPKRKYGNIPTVIDGIEFASRKEAKIYSGLALRQQRGEITGLSLQVPYSLDVNGHHIADYIADFVFREAGVIKVKDAKGVKTPAFKLKSKLMLAVHGVVVDEV